MKYALRIIVLPFWAGIILVQLVRNFFHYCINFVRYGGEAISYFNKNQRKCINDIYLELVNSRESMLYNSGFDKYEYAGHYLHYHPVTDDVIIESPVSEKLKEEIISRFKKALISGEVTKYIKNDKI